MSWSFWPKDARDELTVSGHRSHSEDARHQLEGTHRTQEHRIAESTSEPSEATIIRNAHQLGPMLGRIVLELTRHAEHDYAGTVSGGAIDVTVSRRAESRAPGRIDRAAPWMFYEQRYEATADLVQKWHVVREAADELARVRRAENNVGAGDVVLAEAIEYRQKGRPRSKPSNALARASEATGIEPDDLRGSVSRGRQRPHPALVAAALAEVAAGVTIAAVARELGANECTVRRWQKMHG